MTEPSFPAYVQDRLEYTRLKYPKPITSKHQAYTLIKDELDELWDEVRKENFKQGLLTELLDIAAVCQRVAEDLNL